MVNGTRRWEGEKLIYFSHSLNVWYLPIDYALEIIRIYLLKYILENISEYVNMYCKLRPQIRDGDPVIPVDYQLHVEPYVSYV
jgi:hypothetical protein